ncbi:MAG TPA: Ig-like domain-containing protein, partial [Gemmatimonadales bacterium]|nr:Ig-like domain-containing protein [Gemmatimonadales bacterium]
MRRTFLPLLILCHAPACGDSTGPERPDISVSVTNFLRFMEAGESFRFVAVVSGATGQVGWTSSNQSVVTIDQTGLAVAHTSGASDIRATFGSASFGWLLTVVRPIATLAIEPAGVELVPGDKVQLMVVPADATGAPVTDTDGDRYELAATAVWSIADLTVARAEDAGQPALLTVLREAQTTVGAELLGHDASTTLAGRL